MRKKTRLFAALAALLALLCAHAWAQQVEQVEPTVRVLLRSLSLGDAVHIEFGDDYALEGGAMAIRAGTSADVALRDGRLVWQSGGIAVSLGERARFLRCAGETPGGVTLNGSGRYEGDLTLFAQDGALAPVLSIDVEDYLRGVVPYEMGDSFPLEALKAQAVAARTYALRKRDPSSEYDLLDTTADQVFRGISGDHPLSWQAVYETAGQVGMVGGALAQCYYAASNGGQTELGEHVWPDEDPNAYAYMDMRDDPYDFENEQSPVHRYTVRKKPGEAGVGAALHSALVAALAEPLAALGYAAEDDLVRIDEVKAVEALAPMYEGGSRLMTQLSFTLRLSVRRATFRDASPTPTPQPDAALSPQPTATPQPAPTATPAYSPYEEIAQDVTVRLPIFGNGGGEQAMGLSINTKPNELVTVTDIGSAFMIEARRYGHGVGMSQRGAEQMARAYGMTMADILAFYYPGMQIATVTYERQALPTPDARLLATPAPTPSPTPRPTLMPVTSDALAPGEYVAVVSNIEEDSTLNLREGASLSAEVLRRLYWGQRVIVVSVSADGWARVRTDVIEGYVRAEFLQSAEDGE